VVKGSRRLLSRKSASFFFSLSPDVEAAGVKLQTGGNHLDYRPLPILRDDINVGDGPQRAKGLLLVVGCLEFPQLRAAQAGLHGAQRGADVPQCFNGQKPLK
jgi:hypothetical protein